MHFSYVCLFLLSILVVQASNSSFDILCKTKSYSLKNCNNLKTFYVKYRFHLKLQPPNPVKKQPTC